MKCKDCGNTHPALSGFPNHVLCNYYHFHMSNIADASRCEHFMLKVTTNADRIRNMTDEELAKWMVGEQINGIYAFLKCLEDDDLLHDFIEVINLHGAEQIKKEKLEWLKQPYNEEGET